MGALFGGGSKTQTTSNSTSPWAPQIPYIQAGGDQALSLFNQQKNQPAYSGELYASLNPQQQQALAGLNSYATGGGSTIADILSRSGMAGLSGLPNAANAAGGVLSASLSDPTQSNIADAGAYANNPYTQGMIDAANRPIEQQLNESAIPGLNRAAIASGNFGSSRAGTVEAILRRNAGTQEADNASNILGSQYNSGLNLAQNARQSGLNTALGAGGLYANLGTAGAGLLNSGYNTAINNLNIPLQTGAAYQQNQQGQDQAAYQAYQNQLQQPWNVLDQYWNIAGKPLGQNTTGTQTTEGGGPGVLGGLLGLATGIGSMFLPTGPMGLGASMASSIGGMFK